MSNTRTIKRLRQDAKELKKAQNISQHQALDLIAEQHGYKNWTFLTQNTIDDKVLVTPLNSLELSDESLKQQNKELLTEYGIDFSVLTITATGIKKSIMDAVGSLRNFLVEEGFHNYEEQKQGESYKVVKPCQLITSEKIVNKKVSLYRPVTKKGDPRIWVYGLSSHVRANDELAFFIVDDLLYVLNLNLVDISDYTDLLFAGGDTHSSNSRQL